MMQPYTIDYRPWRIHKVFERVARKSYICEACGCEIPKGDRYLEYKPLPYHLGKGKFKAEKWRKRCLDHPPKYYEEADLYHEGHLIINSVDYSFGGN